MTETRKAIVIGVGSSVVAALMLPVITAGARRLSNFLSTAFASYSSSLYRDVARGSHEHAAGTLVYIMFYAASVGAVAFVASLVVVFRTTKAGTDETRRRRMELFLEGFTKGTLLGAVFPVCLIAAFNATESAVVVGKETVYQQLRALDGPFLDDGELKRLDSKFAQIQSQADYQSIIDGLERIATQHGLRIPE